MFSRRLAFFAVVAAFLTSATRPGFAEKPLRLFFEKKIETAKRPEQQQHVVQEGEWLIRILAAKGYSNPEIQKLLPVVRELNPDIADLNKLQPGQILQLPGEGPSLKIRPAVPPESYGKKKYTVKAGDTLVSILKREGVPQELIFKDYLGLFLELNPQVPNTNTLRVGQEIILPVPGGSVQTAAVSTTPPPSAQAPATVAAPAGTPTQTGPGGAGAASSGSSASGSGRGSSGRGAGGSPSGAKAAPPVQTVQVRPSAVEKAVNATKEKEEEKKPVTGLPLIRSVLEQMRFRFTPGQEALYPLPTGGWLHVNLEESPLFDTPWGERVVFASTPKNQEWIDSAKTLGMTVCSVSPNWSLQEALEKLSDVYPQTFRLWAKDRDLVRFKNGLSITLKGPQTIVLERSAEKAVYMLWPRQTATEPSLPQGLPEVLSQARIKIIEMDMYNKPSRLPARPRGSVYVPFATHTDILQALRLKNQDDKKPQNLTELLQLLKGKDMLQEGMARAAWYSGPRSLAVQVPAWILGPEGSKVIMLDRRFKDESLISILTEAGYSCFVLPD